MDERLPDLNTKEQENKQTNKQLKKTKPTKQPNPSLPISK